MPAYWFEARRHYFRKNHGTATTMLADTVWVIGYATFRVRRALQRKPDHDPHRFLWDFLRYNLFPKRNRRTVQRTNRIAPDPDRGQIHARSSPERLMSP
jgi:hypothetical protein